jgi:hypothetical protein
MTEEAYIQSKQQSSLWLWVDLLVGPIVWSVQFLLVYLFSEGICMGGRLPFSLLDRGVVIGILGGVTLAALALVIWRGLVAYRLWRNPGGVEREADPDWASEGRTSFMHLSTTLLCGFFALVILMTLLPVLVLEPCGMVGV